MHMVEEMYVLHNIPINNQVWGLYWKISDDGLDIADLALLSLYIKDQGLIFFSVKIEQGKLLRDLLYGITTACILTYSWQPVN